MDSSLHFPKVVKYEMAEAFASLQLIKRKSLFGPAPTESQVEFPEVPSQLRTEAAVCLSGNLDQVQRDREFFRTQQKLLLCILYSTVESTFYTESVLQYDTMIL